MLEEDVVVFQGVRGQVVDRRARILECDDHARTQHEQRHADHQRPLQHVGQHVCVGAADEDIAGDEDQRNDQRLHVGQPEERLHDDRDAPDQQHDERERQQVQHREEQSKTLGVKKPSEPISQIRYSLGIDCDECSMLSTMR